MCPSSTADLHQDRSTPKDSSVTEHIEDVAHTSPPPSNPDQNEELSSCSSSEVSTSPTVGYLRFKPRYPPKYLDIKATDSFERSLVREKPPQ